MGAAAKQCSCLKNDKEEEAAVEDEETKLLCFLSCTSSKVKVHPAALQDKRHGSHQ